MFDLAFDGAIARLSLNRPEARNAIPLAEWARLADAAAEAVARGARVLIVQGEGPAFCAGADISEFGGFADDGGKFRKSMRVGLDGLAALPVPTIAWIEGDCYGAGVALAMACDIRVAGGAARFAVTPAKLGISYPQEDVHRLLALVGPGQAARLLFGAQAVDGAEALRIGLVELCHEDGAGDAVAALAGAIVANDGDSLAILKRGIGCGARSDAGQDRAFDAMLGSDVLAERLARHRGRKG